MDYCQFNLNRLQEVVLWKPVTCRKKPSLNFMPGWKVCNTLSGRSSNFLPSADSIKRPTQRKAGV